ncbi:MAG TPA: tetratricopeptide repeat protein [Desulfobacterales bacterium]|nr:tetratricopeptide repeat protein [Desulfobacterales bacterium]
MDNTHKANLRSLYSMKNILFSLFLVLLFLSGCATNPVTGKKDFILVSESSEIDIGKQQYAPMRQSQGGDYTVDKELTAYVSEVGQKLAAVSDRKLPYEFKVLNNSVPNAWALPGGKIVINRGLLTELKDEAELAAVLGHEIVHAAARHGALAMSRGMLMQGAMLATVVASQGEDYAQLAQMGAGLGAKLITTKNGRDAEREADFYGMEYMSRAGYDLQGAIDLQKTFVKLSEGRNENWLTGLFASHPPSRERVENNIQTAAGRMAGGVRAKARFQSETAHIVNTKPAYEAYDKGRKALGDGKIDEARKLARQALAGEPREGHFYALLGDIELKNKKPEAAKRYYDKAISLNDQFFYYHLQRGLLNEQLGFTGDAKNDLDNSLKLLPTATAYNSLGNIARQEGDIRLAKEHYARAAGNKDELGKKAYSSLVELDLADHPGKYIKIRNGLNRQGGVIAQIGNPTPKDMKDLVIGVEYPDGYGRTQRIQKPLAGILKAGTQEVIDLGTGKMSQEQLRRLKTGVIRANVVN